MKHINKYVNGVASFLLKMIDIKCGMEFNIVILI